MHDPFLFCLSSCDSTNKLACDTTHRSTFKHHPVSYKRYSRPITKAPKQLPFEGSTTTSRDYPAWKGVKPSTPKHSVHKHATRGVGEPDHRDWQTEARSCFAGNRPAQRTRSFKPKNDSILLNLKLDTDTTNKSDFVNFATQGPVKARSCKPTNKTHLVDKEDRDWSTTARDGLKRHSVRPRQPIRKRGMSEMQYVHNQPLDAITTNKTDFPHWKGATRSAAFKPKEDMFANKEDRRFETEATTQYGKKAFISNPPTHSTRSAKNRDYSHLKLKLDSSTTTKSDYPHWKHARPATPTISAHERSEKGANETDARNFTTENRQQYIPKRQTRVRGFHKESRSFKLTPDDRDWNTEAKTTLKPHRYMKRKSFKPVDKALVNEAPLSARTTHKETFQTWKCKPASSYKPHTGLHIRKEDRDFNTEAKNQFPDHHISGAHRPCPARYLKASTMGYVPEKHRMHKYNSQGRWTPSVRSAQSSRAGSRRGSRSARPQAM